MLALMAEAILDSVYLTIAVPIESFLLSMGLYTGALHSHYQLLLEEVNELVDRDTSVPDAQLLLETKTRLIEAINFHNQAKA